MRDCSRELAQRQLARRDRPGALRALRRHGVQPRRHLATLTFFSQIGSTSYSDSSYMLRRRAM